MKPDPIMPARRARPQPAPPSRPHAASWRSPAAARRALGAVAALALCLAGPATALAERADRAKPINVEADSLQYDDLKQVNVFTGNVTLTKGTIVIRADRMVIRQDPEGFQYGTAYGNPATFRQKREGVDQFVVGVGQQLDYDGKTETFKLNTRANLKRLEKERVTDEVHGNLIVYDSLNEHFTVQGGGPASATPENPSGRVRVVIQPKNTATPAPAPVPLKPAEQVQGGRK